MEDIFANKYTCLKALTYRPRFDYLINTTIIEYDIRKANVNVLFAQGVLTLDQYLKYKNSLTRREDVGWLMKRNPDISRIFIDGLYDARRNFIEANNLDEQDIISCRSDALFVINKTPVNTKFGTIEFVLKNKYTSFIKLGNLDIYYYYDPITSREVLDIKGMSDEAKAKHTGFFIEFLLTVLNSLQTDPFEALNILQGFNDAYIKRELDIGYYRTFDQSSSYVINQYHSNQVMRYIVNELYNIPIECVDIDYNLYLIRVLYKYISAICFKKRI